MKGGWFGTPRVEEKAVSGIKERTTAANPLNHEERVRMQKGEIPQPHPALIEDLR